MFTSTEVEDAAIVNTITAILEEYPKELETEYNDDFPTVTPVEP